MILTRINHKKVMCQMHYLFALFNKPIHHIFIEHPLYVRPIVLSSEKRQSSFLLYEACILVGDRDTQVEK